MELAFRLYDSSATKARPSLRLLRTLSGSCSPTTTAGAPCDDHPRTPRPRTTNNSSPRSQAVPGPGRHRSGAIDGGARRVGRDHRVTLRPKLPPHLDRKPSVDVDRLHPGIRWTAPAGGTHRRLPRS